MSGTLVPIDANMVPIKSIEKCSPGIYMPKKKKKGFKFGFLYQYIWGGDTLSILEYFGYSVSCKKSDEREFVPCKSAPENIPQCLLMGDDTLITASESARQTCRIS